MPRNAVRLAYIDQPANRLRSFNKRLEGLMKKSMELHILTGALVRLKVAFQGKHYLFENGEAASPDAAEFAAKVAAKNARISRGSDAAAAAFAAKNASSGAAGGESSGAADRRQEIDIVPQPDEIEIVSDGDGGGFGLVWFEGPAPLNDAAVLRLIGGKLQEDEGDKWDDVKILTDEEVESL